MLSFIKAERLIEFLKSSLGTCGYIMRMFLDILRWFAATSLLCCLLGCGSEGSNSEEVGQDIPPGALVNYHPNGTKKLEEFYKGDLRHGLSTKWDANGTIIEQLRYEDDKLVETIVGNQPNRDGD